MIVDFLKTTRTPEELRAALEVLREFKTSHSEHEDLSAPLVAWTKLEQLEEFLDHLVNGALLRADTLEYISAMQAERP